MCYREKNILQNIQMNFKLQRLKYFHVSGVCVTYKTGFGSDDLLYCIFMQLVTTFHKSQSSTGHSTSDHTTLIHSCLLNH
jgi:hypothetical protein